MNHALPLLHVTLILAAAPHAIAETDWARFHGSNGSGVANTTALPVTLDSQTTLWRIDLGEGWSAPVLWKDRVIVTAEVEPSKYAVLCLDAATGKQIWSHTESYTSHPKHQLNRFASTTPFVDADRIYVTWASGPVIQALALNHDGTPVWHNPHVANFVHEHGSGSSPIVQDGILIVRAEFTTQKGGKKLASEDQMDWTSSIVGLDAATGKQVWKLGLPNSVIPYSTPIIRKRKSDGRHEFIVANTTSGIFAVDVLKGNITWQHNPGYRHRSVGSVILHNDVAFATFGAGDGSKESAILDLSTDEPKELPNPLKNIPYVPTSIAMGDRLYLLRDGGIFSCAKWPSGEELFTERLSGTEGRSTQFFSSPVSADGKIYCASQTGDVVVIKPADTFEVLGVSKLDAPINATPAIGDRRIFIRTEKSLYSFSEDARRVP